MWTCTGSDKYQLLYSSLLRSYRLRNRFTRLLAAKWYTKEFVRQKKRGQERVVDTVIRLTERYDEYAAIEAAMKKKIDQLSNPVWIGPVIQYNPLPKESNMEVVDIRNLPVTISMFNIPTGTVFAGNLKNELPSIFLRFGGKSAWGVIDLKHLGSHWLNSQHTIYNYQPVHGKITIERNA